MKKGTTAKRKENALAPIACGTDFSENARQAVRVAAALGRRLNEPVHLVNALNSPSLSSPDSDVVKWLKSSRRKALGEEAEQIRAYGAEVKEKLIIGRADEVLVDLAREGKARLLVIASLGVRGLDHWFLGGISERTAERSPVPTLVVRDAEPFEAWATGERPLKVFVAFNFSATSDEALGWVKGLQALGPCELVVGYVDWPPDERIRFGNTGPLPLVGNRPDVQAALERDVRRRAVELLGDIPLRVRIEANWGRSDAQLAEMAGEEGADLIVVGSRQYHGFERLWNGSVSRGLLHDAKMSVAVVPLVTRRFRATSIAPPVRRVLVTTDFSDTANHAIAHAFSLVRGGGVVHLVYVANPDELPGGEHRQGLSGRRFDTKHAQHIQECAEKLRELIPAEAAAHGIATEVDVIEHRDAAEAVGQVAERFGVDVICLGSHGRSGLSKALLGSVAQKVMAQSKRPLFVIRPPVE